MCSRQPKLPLAKPRGVVKTPDFLRRPFFPRNTRNCVSETPVMPRNFSRAFVMTHDSHQQRAFRRVQSEIRFVGVSRHSRHIVKNRGRPSRHCRSLREDSRGNFADENGGSQRVGGKRGKRRRFGSAEKIGRGNGLCGNGGSFVVRFIGGRMGGRFRGVECVEKRDESGTPTDGGSFVAQGDAIEIGIGDRDIIIHHGLFLGNTCFLRRIGR